MAAYADKEVQKSPHIIPICGLWVYILVVR